MRSHPPHDDRIATLTHARLRASQGDYAAAVLLLRRILARTPDLDEARELLRSIEGRPDRSCSDSDAEPPPEPTPGDPAQLAGVFKARLGGETSAGEPRVGRLRAWLGKIRRDR